MKLDLHVHSNVSLDSNLSVEKIAKLLKERGLDGSALTDHNTVVNLNRAKAVFSKNGLEFIPGIEVTTKSGHLIGLFVEEKIKDHTSLEEAIDEIKSRGGITVIPHPFDKYRKNVGDDAFKVEFDCIEAFNARTIFREGDEMTRKKFKNKNVTFVASSDSHTPGEIGGAYTKIKGHDPHKALLKGDTELYCRYSPFNVHIKSVFNRIENIIVRK